MEDVSLLTVFTLVYLLFSFNDLANNAYFCFAIHQKGKVFFFFFNKAVLCVYIVIVKYVQQ